MFECPWSCCYAYNLLLQPNLISLTLFHGPLSHGFLQNSLWSEAWAMNPSNNLHCQDLIQNYKACKDGWAGVWGFGAILALPASSPFPLLLCDSDLQSHNLLLAHSSHHLRSPSPAPDIMLPRVGPCFWKQAAYPGSCVWAWESARLWEFSVWRTSSAGEARWALEGPSPSIVGLLSFSFLSGEDGGLPGTLADTPSRVTLFCQAVEGSISWQFAWLFFFFFNFFAPVGCVSILLWAHWQWWGEYSPSVLGGTCILSFIQDLPCVVDIPQTLLLISCGPGAFIKATDPTSNILWSCSLHQGLCGLSPSPSPCFCTLSPSQLPWHLQPPVPLNFHVPPHMDPKPSHHQFPPFVAHIRVWWVWELQWKLAVRAQGVVTLGSPFLSSSPPYPWIFLLISHPSVQGRGSNNSTIHQHLQYVL